MYYFAPSSILCINISPSFAASPPLYLPLLSGHLSLHVPFPILLPAAQFSLFHLVFSLPSNSLDRHNPRLILDNWIWVWKLNTQIRELYSVPFETSRALRSAFLWNVDSEKIKIIWTNYRKQKVTPETKTIMCLEEMQPNDNFMGQINY